jgi:hypothetical protein
MTHVNGARTKLIIVVMLLSGALLMMFVGVKATSQWSRQTSLPCETCHTVFPRLNAFGEQYLRNGYEFVDNNEEYAGTAGGVFVGKVEHLFGFRLNVTPLQYETNTFQEDSASEKKSRLTLGSPIWLQAFVAGNVYKNISFFSELEYAQSSFKFNWFYFNFTRLGKTPAINFQVGNLSPLEFASYPNRLPQLPNLKGEVMLIKSSDGKGEESIDLSSARPGIQYFGHTENDVALVYAGVSPGTKAANVNQSLHYWGGLVLRLPENAVKGLEGSSATIHIYQGTDTKNTGEEKPGPQVKQVENKFTRISPQINIRYKDRLDIQAAMVFAKDENWKLVANPAADYKYSGVAFEGGYMPNNKWHLGLHYDKYSSKDKFAGGPYDGDPIVHYQRVVPAVTYIINQNIRFTLYWEKNLSDERGTKLVDKLVVNMRTMF